ncbi:MAG: response regulator [bacterium]|nr:response regulator [bacterium]
MESIQYKILINFCLIAAISIVILGVVISWKLSESISLQSQKLSSDMTARTNEALKGHYRMLMRNIPQDVRRNASGLSKNPIVVERLESGLITALEVLLEQTVEMGGIDFAILFTIEGQLQASSPHDLNDLEMEAYFKSWELGRLALQFLKGETPHDGMTATWDAISKHDAHELDILGLGYRDPDGKGSISIASTGIITDDFGDPLGIYLVGKLLNDYEQPLERVYDITGSASVIYLDTTPLVQAGFDGSGEEEFDIDALRIRPEIQAEVYQTDESKNLVLAFADVPYLTTCSTLESSDHGKFGAICVGVPESQITEAQQVITLHGIETKKSVEAWIVMIGLASLSLFIIVSLAVATRIVTPLKQLSQIAKRIAQRDFQQEIAISSQDEIGELSNSLREVVKSFQEITATSEAIAMGNLHHEITPRSDRDVLGHALQNMLIFLNQMASVAEAIAEGDLRQEIQPKSDRDVLGQAFYNVVVYFREMSGIATKIAVGDLRQVLQPKTEHDVLGQAFQQMMEYVQNVTAVAESVSDGDLRVHVTPKSQQDILNHSLEKMIRYIQDVANVAEKISTNDFYVDVRPKSGQDVLNISLQRMVANLQTAQRKAEESMAEVEQQNWFKTGQAELNDAMHGEHDIATLAQHTITYLANYLQTQIGALYLADDEAVLHLVGSYAYATRKANRNEFKLGEGLIGQAALEKRSILFTSVPDDYMSITSGLGETNPRHILVTPFMHEGAVGGVIELGTVQEFTEMQRAFLEQACDSVAITFHAAQSRVKMRELLEETQQQSETLQVQQEELRQANQELAGQTTVLRTSEERLQTQQEELRRTNEELETQTRTLEHQKQELEESNLELNKARKIVERKAKDLELSSKYKSEFLANMSHELRTPLNSLLILSQLLVENKDANLTTKQVEFAKTIHAAGVDLLELINEVLDLSKLEAGRMILNIDEMRLKGLAGYIERHFAHVAEQKGLSLTVTLADGLPESIRIDRQRVEQIVKNFLSNAIKFTEKGGVDVRIDRPAADVDLSHSGLDLQHVIAISVSDTGIGISEDKQRLIFEAFQQADGSTSRKYGGTGLGLSISRELVKLLGGEMRVRSTEGQGSTFTLYLSERFWQKLSREEQAAKDAEQAAGDADRETIPASPPAPPPSLVVSSGVDAIRDDRHDTFSPTDKFLLIIEDDPKFAKILFDLAREKEFKALIAGDGAAGLQLAYQYKPQAILLDIGLPGVSGWIVMEKLKANPETRHIPVHFISAEDTALDAMKMGAVGYLTKPVTLDKLRNAFTAIEENLAKTLKKVLIVEDNETMRISMLELLSAEDVVITTADTGQEAYDLLQAEPFDCLVLDLGLADISGFDVLEKVKMDAALFHLPIIVYTGKELSQQDEKYLKQYAESIIIKGVKSPERLLDEVTLFLHRVETDLPGVQHKKGRIFLDKEEILEGRTILMADDDIRNVFALSSVLDEKGMKTLIAENGKEALELLEANPEIDLVLMDIMMPEMDGYEMMQAIRTQPEYNKLPIIALTAKAMKGDRQKCLEAGANDYLSKPVDTDKLLSLLRVWLY